MDAQTLEKPLDPELKYFDASAAIKALTEEVGKLHRMILLQQDINGKLLLITKDFRDRIEALEAKRPSIILPN